MILRHISEIVDAALPGGNTLVAEAHWVTRLAGSGSSFPLVSSHTGYNFIIRITRSSCDDQHKPDVKNVKKNEEKQNKTSKTVH